MNTISSHLALASEVLANRYASGAAIAVERAVTHAPSTNELKIVFRLSLSETAAHAPDRSKRPSGMTALANIMTNGQTINIARSRPSIQRGPLCFQLSDCFIWFSPDCHRQISLSLAAVSAEISNILSQSVRIRGISSRLVLFSHFTSLRPGSRYASATSCWASSLIR